jgi:uncharacterized protein (TIGR03435 family)
MNAMNGITLTLFATSSAFAQSAPVPEFEVASIRPSAAIGPQGQVSLGLHIDGAQVRGTSFALRDYLAIAYRTKAAQISGPDWVTSDRYDIAATIPADGKASQVPEMLQTLLAERFKLKVHKDKKNFPVYALVVGKGPLKMKEIPADADVDSAEPKGAVAVAGGGSAAGVGVNLGHGSAYNFADNKFEAQKLTMAQFAGSIERFADRPVVDLTELKGAWDFTINLTPEDYRAMLIRAAISAGVALPPEALRALDNTSGGGLADAVTQLGLKLDTRKAPLDVIVVDEGQKTPTAN